MRRVRLPSFVSALTIYRARYAEVLGDGTTKRRRNRQAQPSSIDAISSNFRIATINKPATSNGSFEVLYCIVPDDEDEAQSNHREQLPLYLRLSQRDSRQQEDETCGTTDSIRATEPRVGNFTTSQASGTTGPRHTRNTSLPSSVGQSLKVPWHMSIRQRRTEDNQQARGPRTPTSFQYSAFVPMGPGHQDTDLQLSEPLPPYMGVQLAPPISPNTLQMTSGEMPTVSRSQSCLPYCRRRSKKSQRSDLSTEIGPIATQVDSSSDNHGQAVGQLLMSHNDWHQAAVQQSLFAQSAVPNGASECAAPLQYALARR